MRSAVQFFLFAAFIASSTAVTYVYNVTSGLEDYILLVGRQMQNELDISDLQLATVKARHDDRIDAVDNHQELLLQEIQQFDNIQLQQQAFSLARKHCVQKYKARVPTYNQAKTNLTKCQLEAYNQGLHLTTGAETNLKEARTVREIDLPEIFLSCNKTHSGVSLENCVIQNVEAKVLLFNKNIDQFQIKLHESLFTSSVIVEEATRCSFVVEKRVLTSNGAVYDLVDVCVEELKEDGASAFAIENENVIENVFMQRLRSGRKLIT